MTVIAYKAGILAADRLLDLGGVKTSVTKIFIMRRHLVGAAGDGRACLDALEWFRLGRKASSWPVDKDLDVHLLTIDTQGRVRFFDCGSAEVIEEPFYAIGTGAPFALAAMSMGANARRAVSIASRWDTACGNGCDVLTLDDARGGRK